MPTPSWAHGPARLLLAVVATLVLGACQLRTELNVTVDESGGGTVELAVALDEDAAARRPDLADELTLDDLTDAGWAVIGPRVEDDGNTWIRVRRDFGAPPELAVLVAQITGEDGPFRDFSLVREDAFARTRYHFSGTVDFTDGLAPVTRDEALAESLGADPAEVLRGQFDEVLEELLTVQVAVRLPGEVRSNAVTRADNGAVWQPSVLEREAVQVAATGTLQRSSRLVWLGVAILAGFGFVLAVLLRLVAWRRRAVPDSG